MRERVRKNGRERVIKKKRKRGRAIERERE
jgi:hypothetical protein